MPDDSLPNLFENLGVGVAFFGALRRGQLVAKRARVTKFAGLTTIVLTPVHESNQTNSWTPTGSWNARRSTFGWQRPC